MHTKKLHRNRIEWTIEMVEFLKKNYGIMPTKEIAEKMNCSGGRIRAKAVRLGLKGKKRRRIISDIPTIFNVSSMEKTLDGKVKAQCPYCQEYFYTKPSALALGRRKSCGCINIGARRGSENISANYWGHIYRGAIKRNIEFNIDIEYAEELLKRQNFICNLSKIKLVYGYIPLKNITASLDRIDNNKGYIEGNVQWIHKYINLMKGSLHEDTFLYLCKQLSEQNKERIQHILTLPDRKYRDWEGNK